MTEKNLIRADPALFGAYFDRKPFYVEHALTGHPLFELERLVTLSRELEAPFVEWNAGSVPVGLAQQSPRNGLSAEETLRQIGQNRSWLVLKRVEQHPLYRALLESCLDAVLPHAPPMHDRQGFIFVSSPGSVTPFHMDPEHNFLLQVRGEKTVHMWAPDDRYVVAEQELETFHAAFRQRNLPYRPEFQQTAFVLPLKAGQGVHFPVTVPHWVQNGPEVSVSFSITFRTEASERRRHAHRANGRLRALGLQPTPVGTSALRDGVKALVVEAMDTARARLKR
jgi:hypothetical protein